MPGKGLQNSSSKSPGHRWRAEKAFQFLLLICSLEWRALWLVRHGASAVPQVWWGSWDLQERLGVGTTGHKYRKRIENDRNRVQGLLFSQNFSFWTLRQDSSLKEGLQKANSVLVLEEPLGHRMPMSKYFVWFAYFSLQVNPNSKLRILIFWHEYATAVPTANPTP